MKKRLVRLSQIKRAAPRSINGAPLNDAWEREAVRRFLHYAGASQLPNKKPRPDTCVLWSGPVSGKGRYPTFVVAGHKVSATRFSWRLRNNAEWPTGKVADHTCRVHQCVNPYHIRPITDFENKLIGLQGAQLFYWTLTGAKYVPA